MSSPRELGDAGVESGPARLLVAWERPAMISARQAEAWANDQLAELGADRGVRRWRLLHLTQPASDGIDAFDWLIEVVVLEEADACRLISESPLCDFLSELRSLRCRPLTLLAHERP